MSVFTHANYRCTGCICMKCELICGSLRPENRNDDDDIKSHFLSLRLFKVKHRLLKRMCAFYLFIF